MSARAELVRAVSRTLGRLATAGLLAAGAVAMSAEAASAHPLGNLSVNRATEVVVAPDAIRVLRVVDSAEIPTVQLKAQLADLPGYADSACVDEASTLRVQVRGAVAALAPAGSVATLLPGQAGLRTLRLECRYLARLAVAEGDAIRVVEGSTRIAVGWGEIVIRADGLALRSSDAPNTSPTSLLTRYPDDALASPSDQASADAVVGAASAPAAPADQPTDRAGAVFRPVNTLTAAADRLVSGSATPAALALLAATAFALGAAHALAPGHGKTVMAFYLAGRERRSVWSAAAVVGTVTATHTSTVLLLGLLIGLGTAVAPAAVTLWAGVVSGLLVAAAGAALVVRAWRSRRLDRHGGHVHAYGHGHGHAHSHGHEHPPAHTHAHGHGHSHEAELDHPARGVLVSLGAAGGLVPSPSALLLLLGAVAAGRAFLGVGLVVLFGLGMAATLAAVSGIALGLRARLDGAGGQLGRWWHPVSRLMPVSSGAVICLIGLGMATRGLGAAIA